MLPTFKRENVFLYYLNVVYGFNVWMGTQADLLIDFMSLFLVCVHQALIGHHLLIGHVCVGIPNFTN